MTDLTQKNQLNSSLTKEKSCIIMSLGIGKNLMKIVPFHAKTISENLE